MSSTNLVRSGGYRRGDWEERPLERRSGGGFSRFVVTFGIGVGATLAWQSYGDAIRVMVANTYPQLAWVSPHAVASAGAASTVPDQPPARTAEAQIQELALTIAAMRQRVDQLAAQVTTSQDQMSRDLTAKVQAAERMILDKIAAAQQKPEATAPRGRSQAQATTLR